jgi:hypothetical protein
MNQGFKDALILFGRALFAAAVAGAIAYITHLDLAHITDSAQVGKGLLAAVVDAVLLFLGAYLRNVTTEPVQPVAAQRLKGAGPHFQRTRSWADNLPF